MGDLYLVTGGAGFIGSHVVAELLQRGHAVRILDNFSTGRRGNLTAVGGDVEVVEGDMRSYERAHNAVKGVDLVIHLAALPSVPRSVQDPLTTNEANVTGTLNVLLAARDNGARRVVLAPSSSIYGANPAMPKREDMVPEPISPVRRIQAGRRAVCACLRHRLRARDRVAALLQLFGPRQDPTSQYSGVVPRFMRLAIQGGRPVIFGDGEQSRDFTYVANVVDATLSAATAPGAAGNICNIGCGDPKTVLGLIAAVSRVSGRPLEPEFAPPMAGDVKHSFADIALARKLLGYEPRVGFDEGMGARSPGSPTTCPPCRPSHEKRAGPVRIVVTVDTEADGQWDHGRSLSTGNVAAWPAFQELCRATACLPTWLITSEIADDPAAVAFLRPLALAGEAEVGAHLHPWTTPPFADEPGLRRRRSHAFRATSSPSFCSPSSRR